MLVFFNEKRRLTGVWIKNITRTAWMEKQSPEEFLKNVAEMVSSFARAFGVEDWGDLAWFNLRWFMNIVSFLNST